MNSVQTVLRKRKGSRVWKLLNPEFKGETLHRSSFNAKVFVSVDGLSRKPGESAFARDPSGLRLILLPESLR